MIVNYIVFHQRSHFFYKTKAIFIKEKAILQANIKKLKKLTLNRYI